MTRFFVILALFTAAVLVEVSVLPNIFGRVTPVAMIFFVVSLYWFEGASTVYYAGAAGSIFSVLHSITPLPVLLFVLLSLVSVLFKHILTHRSAPHLLMFLTVNLFVWQLYEAVRSIMSGSFGEGPFFLLFRTQLLEGAFSFSVFLCISCVLFVRQVWGNRRGNLTL